VLFRSLVLAVNKWDLIPNPDETFRRLKDSLDLKLKFLAYAPWIVISALTGRNVGKLFQAIEEIHAQYCFRAGTPEVNKVLEGAVARHPAPMVGRGRLKFYFATQAQTRPPTFVVFTNHPDEVHFSYARYLTNQFKEAFGLTEIPIKVVFRARTRRP
jgi:GTP-binding protein